MREHQSKVFSSSSLHYSFWLFGAISDVVAASYLGSDFRANLKHGNHFIILGTLSMYIDFLFLSTVF